MKIRAGSRILTPFGEGKVLYTIEGPPRWFCVQVGKARYMIQADSGVAAGPLPP